MTAASYMVREPASFLWDAQFAGGNVLQFVAGADFDRYCNDIFLRSAVERQLQNMGEALSQLALADAELAASVPSLRAVVAFRNVLVHGYANLDPALVWSSIHHDLPVLLAAVDAALGKLGPAPTK